MSSDIQTAKVRFATVWLDGCSGCHMSFLDMDERLVALADHIELVYSPIMDAKIFPDQVDLALVEGSVSSTEDLEKIRHIRACTKVLVALGDCAITGNVPAMRNPVGSEKVLQHVYLKNAPSDIVPPLLPKVLPLHQVVTVDAFLPGCPPPADAIYFALTELLAGRIPDLTDYTRFGR
jgi:NAD-reducing hydrogenase small subunit